MLNVHPLVPFFQEQGFPEQEALAIASAFVHKDISKGDFFVQEGKTSKYLGFVEHGFLQYYVLLNGEEKTTYSVGTGNFVASLVSFLLQKPAEENIRAVFDSSLWLLDRAGLQHLQQSIPRFKDYYIRLLEWQLCCIDESRLDAILLTAQQRYEKMLAKDPDLFRQIPLQYLASILGVTPRHLSRIRGKIR
jgi:CRP-like cAMP-binding protein